LKILLHGAFAALCLAPLALGVLFSRWASSTPSSGSRDDVENAPDPRERRAWPASVDTVASHVVKRAPFRADRRAVVTPFRVREAAAAPVASPSRPNLVIKGILWGPDPLVLLDGLPDGLPQRLLRVGDTLGGLRVHKISPTSAVIKGMDTTWVLVLQRPGQ